MSSFWNRTATRPGHTTRLTTRPGHTTRLTTRPGHTTRLSKDYNREIPQNSRSESRILNGVKRHINPGSSLTSFRALVSKVSVALDSFRVHGRGRYFVPCMLLLLQALVLTLCFDTHPQSRRRLPNFSLFGQPKIRHGSFVCSSGEIDAKLNDHGFKIIGTFVKRCEVKNGTRLCYYNPKTQVFIALKDCVDYMDIKLVLHMPTITKKKIAKSQLFGKQKFIWWAKLTGTQLKPRSEPQGLTLLRELNNKKYVGDRLTHIENSLQKDGLPAGWKSAVDVDSGKTYYYEPSNPNTTTFWDRPTEVSILLKNNSDNIKTSTDADLLVQQIREKIKPTHTDAVSSETTPGN